MSRLESQLGALDGEEHESGGRAEHVIEVKLILEWSYWEALLSDSSSILVKYSSQVIK